MVETHLYRAGKTYTGTLTAANIAGSTGQAVTTGGVSYDPNGGDGAMTPTIGESGTGVTAADNAFTRTGYTFAGWNTAKDGTGHRPPAGRRIGPDQERRRPVRAVEAHHL